MYFSLNTSLASISANASRFFSVASSSSKMVDPTHIVLDICRTELSDDFMESMDEKEGNNGNDGI